MALRTRQQAKGTQATTATTISSGARARRGREGVGAFQVEATDIGPQALVTGVAPITPRDRLTWRANAPMEPKKPQRPADAPALSACLAGSRRGLFDTNARNQLEMFR